MARETDAQREERVHKKEAQHICIQAAEPQYAMSFCGLPFNNPNGHLSMSEYRRQVLGVDSRA